MDTKTPSTPTIVLVPGYWLGAWAWDAVAAELRGRGYHVIAVTLPGLDRNGVAGELCLASGQGTRGFE